jgi:Domain of unknown function (DUF4177)
MATTMKRRYKVMELNPDEQGWAAQLEETVNRQAQDGWELVTVFQREHETQQVGSSTVHLPSLVTLVLIFKLVA